jgi:hypothetical protein
MPATALCTLILTLSLAATETHAQARTGPTRQQLDTMRMDQLHTSGRHSEGRRVSIWYPADSLDSGRVVQLAGSLDSVVQAVDSMVGGPYPWQAYRHPRVSYYITPERFVAHTTAGPNVFMPLWRVRGDSAPWVHETAHAILYPARPPFFLNPDTAARRIEGSRALVWLEEGLAEYIADSLAYMKLPNFDVQQSGGRAGIDATCSARLKQPGGQAVLPYLGLSGQPPGLEGTGRAQLAPPFYACGFSYVTFLVKHYPLSRIAAVRNSPDQLAAFTALVGDPARLRQQWLQSLP